MISDILDACREVLEINGDPQTAYWLASQLVEMRMWRANEQDVRAALERNIGKLGESTLRHNSNNTTQHFESDSVLTCFRGWMAKRVGVGDVFGRFTQGTSQIPNCGQAFVGDLLPINGRY